MQQSLEECQTYLSHNVFHHTIGGIMKGISMHLLEEGRPCPCCKIPEKMKETDNPSNDEKLKLNNRTICAANNPGCLESDAAF
jgi:hypothetical protein